LPEKEMPTVGLVDASHLPDLEPLATQRLLDMDKIEIANNRVGRDLERAAVCQKSRGERS
jgi:hypothetical protein